MNVVKKNKKLEKGKIVKQSKQKQRLVYLGAENYSTVFKEKREITGEVKTPRQPSPLGDIQLGPTGIAESLHVEYRPPKRFRVGGGSVANATESFDGHHHLPLWHIPEEPGTAPGRGIQSGFGSSSWPNRPDPCRKPRHRREVLVGKDNHDGEY